MWVDTIMSNKVLNKMGHSKEYWLAMKWGDLRLDPNQALPDSWGMGSRKFYFVCACGRRPSIFMSNMRESRNTTSCGKCNYKPKAFWLTQRWGKLRLDPTANLPDEWSVQSNKKFPFVCDCGRGSNLSFSNLSRSRSCGGCSALSKSFWLTQRWGKLKLDPNQDLPGEWPAQRNKKLWFLCDCGRRSLICMQGVTQRNRSCGRCSELPKSYWIEQVWGKLKLAPEQRFPEEWGKGSRRLFFFNCKCGKRKSIEFRAVSGGGISSCAACTALPKEHWLSQRWGNLKLSSDQPLPDEWTVGIGRKFEFVCDCGGRNSSNFNSVVKGDSATCGHCYDSSKDYWLTQHWGNIKLDPAQILPDGWGTGSELRFTFICECGNKITPMFYNVANGHTLSCGCLKVGENVFSIEAEIRRFVTSLAPDTHPISYLIEGSRRKYDIYSPLNRFALEYHGLRWHSEEFCREGQEKKDYKKYQLACSRGDRLIQIYGDEWENKQEIIKAQIKDILAPEPKIRIKPAFEVIRGKTPPEARSFLDAHHYLGAASGCVTIVARHREAIVGTWVFMKRETGVVLWHRACWDRAYKSWNPHEKALTLALPALRELGFTRMVTFSDNRFHTGALYEKLGFTFEEEIKPDYSYTNSYKRKAKESLRVRAGVDESKTAAASGWFRIWDSGKKRYSLSI